MTQRHQKCVLDVRAFTGTYPQRKTKKDNMIRTDDKSVGWDYKIPVGNDPALCSKHVMYDMW
ncbi:MAG: hypothetical protein OXC46_06825 [Thaumarchaeota archaeon]|nr:hypothetical protein [Nitrososphaerota archaeon]